MIVSTGFYDTLANVRESVATQRLRLGIIPPEGGKAVEVWLSMPGSGTVSVNDNDYNHSVLYPSPVSDFLNLKLLSAESYRIVITDMHGKTVKEVELKSGEQRLDLRSLRPGMYLIEMNSAEMHFQRKILKE